MRGPRFPPLLAAAAALLAWACGYRFSAAGGPLPGGVRSIDVPVLKNRTTEPDLPAWLTGDLRREIVRAGHGGGEESDARLSGVIESVGGMPLVLKAGPIVPGGSAAPGQPLVPWNPGLYQVSATVTVQLWRGGELLAQLDHVTETDSYLPADDLATNEANRRLALRRLSRTLAREIVERLAEAAVPSKKPLAKAAPSLDAGTAQRPETPRPSADEAPPSPLP